MLQERADELVRWHTKSSLVKFYKGHHVSFHGCGERGVLWHAVGRELRHHYEPLVCEAL
jgi:hypothetical protein